MKVKDLFILKNIAGSNVVMPVGVSAEQFDGMISLNETGVLLWNRLSEDVTEEDLINTVLSEYNVSADEAERDVKEFVESLRKVGVLEE